MELRSDLSSRVRSSAELVAVEAESVLLKLLLLLLLLLNWLRVAVLYDADRAVRRGRLSIERGLSEPAVPQLVGVALFCRRRVSNRVALAGSRDLEGREKRFLSYWLRLDVTSISYQ